MLISHSVASRKPTRSRKRRNPAGTPRAVASTRRDERAEREAQAAQLHARERRRLGREGERPPGPFGGLPVSELAILAGLVAAVVGYLQGASTALIGGLIICSLGVVEITAREHFSGYRSHTALLAGIPAVALEVVLALTVAPRERPLLLVLVVPVFALLFWLLRRRFAAARQARVSRPRVPPVI